MNTLNTKYALAPHTIRLGETDQNGHLSKVKARVSGRKAEKGGGAGSIK